ncbi:MAG: ParA family protein [Raineya sp.]|jgi:chromosome partitioning protein|nr:ParA family protein [Raineya sp.]
MTQIIAMANHKGGVGKTTTTANLGKALSLKGKKTLVIDIDAQANLSQGLGFEDVSGNIYEVLCENKAPNLIHVGDNFDLLPGSLDLAKADVTLQAEGFGGYIKLKKKVSQVIKNYDYVLIDCPPSLGILTTNALALATSMLVTTEAEFYSLKGLQTIIELFETTVEDLNPNLNFMGIVLTKINSTNLKKDIMEVIQERYKDKVFKTTIRNNIKLAEAAASRTDIFTYDSESNGAEDYRNLADEILKKNG